MPKDKKTDYLNEVANIVKQGRKNIQARNENMADLLNKVQENFSDLGMRISIIQLGEETIELGEKSKKVASGAKDEEYFTQLLNNGVPVYILTVHNDFISYSDREKVLFSKQKLSDLIDESLVKKLAPNCKIYSPKDKKPWKEIIERESFEIFLTDYQELTNLWQNLKSWAKTDWHDTVMKKQWHFHKAEDVFLIEIVHGIAPDLSWRYAQHKNAEKKTEKAEELGEWDALAQQELKKTINSLLQIEEHPILGKNISKILDEVKPMLAQSMEGKKVLEKIRKEEDKARKNLDKGFNVIQINWRDWEPQIPLAETKGKK